MRVGMAVFATLAAAATAALTVTAVVLRLDHPLFAVCVVAETRVAMQRTVDAMGCGWGPEGME